MNEELVKQRLYDRYIAPTFREREDYIGVEFELPIVNLKKEAVDFDIVHAVTADFLEKFHFHATGIDDDQAVYAAEDDVYGDVLSYDCSFNNLELSLGKGKTLYELYLRFADYYGWLQERFGREHHALTGMGVNPYREYNHAVPIHNGRYRMLFHHLESYKKYFDKPMYFHRHPAFGLFSSATQVQLDVHGEKLLSVINIFSKLEPIKGLLFSNSVLLGERDDLLCCRDMFWENSTHGINPHNIGMFDAPLESLEDLQAYIESTSIYCVERGDKYINFAPIPIMEYFRQYSVEGEYFDKDLQAYQTIEVTPEIDDIQYLRTFKFEDLTFRGTIEFRSGCCQPVSDVMTIAAFHLGLKENLEALGKLLDEDEVLYHHGYTATELRKMLIQRKLPGFVDPDALYGLARQVVDLAKEGLKKRKFGEEAFLDPLYQRIRDRENPAQKMLRLLEEGKDLEAVIDLYGRLKQE